MPSLALGALASGPSGDLPPFPAWAGGGASRRGRPWDACTAAPKYCQMVEKLRSVSSSVHFLADQLAHFLENRHVCVDQLGQIKGGGAKTTLRAALLGALRKQIRVVRLARRPPGGNPA